MYRYIHDNMHTHELNGFGFSYVLGSGLVVWSRYADA